MTRLLRYGDYGPDVGEVQQRLIEQSLPVRPFELAIATIGDTTRDAIREFQRSQGLDPDGVVGLKTLYALAHPAEPKLTALSRAYDRTLVSPEMLPVCDAAWNDIGLREDPDGSNDGPMLTKFQTHGARWCACAICTWFEQFPNGRPFPRTASTWTLYQWFVSHGLVVPWDTKAAPGDIFYVKRKPATPSDPPPGHVALVIGTRAGADADRNLLCVGGNEGNQVRCSWRARFDATALLRTPPPW